MPQRAAFTIGISTDDGKSRSYELEPAELLGGKLYTVTVTVTRIDVSCTLSGEIKDWVPGRNASGTCGAAPIPRQSTTKV